MTFPIPDLGNPLITFGGPIAVRVELDTGLEGEIGSLWDVGLWGVGVWGGSDASWFDITQYVLKVDIAGGAEKWGQRFTARTATIEVMNTTGIFTPESGVAVPWLQPFRPGRRCRVVAIPDPTAPLDKVPLFVGRIDASNDQFGNAGFDITARITATDGLGVLAAFDPPALETPTGVQSTDERVEAALDRAGWSVSARDIQAGSHSMMSSHLAQTALEECGKAADAEGGAFFLSPAGDAVFRARDWLITDARSVNIQGYLGYDETPADTQSAHVLEWRTSWEIQRIVNQVLFARTGSTMQLAEDTASQALLDEIRGYERTDYENNADDEILWLAERYLAVHKDLRVTVDEVTISGNADPDNEDLNRLLWDSQYGDLLQIRVGPPYGWELERATQIMGISHSITADDWLTTFKLDDSLASTLDSS